MTLGDLIDGLENVPTGWSVRFSSGDYPDHFASWRGVYAHLTLCPSADGRLKDAGDLLVAAHAANGGTFEGWKGGDYTMDRDTPLWADDEGEYSCWGIIGVVRDNVTATVTLQIAEIGEYQGW